MRATGVASLVRTLPRRADQNVAWRRSGRPEGGAELREERKVVTTLFADLVGSTPLGERLEPEEVRLVVGEAVARIGPRRSSGSAARVKDLAGDGVLAFFGAPVAYEDDAERAVREPVCGSPTRWPPTQARSSAAGASTASACGSASRRARWCSGRSAPGRAVEYAAFGDTVNTAARLQAAAEPGTVLADADTRRQLEPLFEWGEEQAVELKGKTSPVAASVAGRPRAEAVAAEGLDGPEVDLVGRPAELTSSARFSRPRAGSGGVVFVTGEAGIGKSRLLAEMHGLAEAAGDGPQPLWLEGRCVSYGESLPYWPFRDLLREWLGAGRDEPELRLRVALRPQRRRTLRRNAATRSTRTSAPCSA